MVLLYIQYTIIHSTIGNSVNVMKSLFIIFLHHKVSSICVCKQCILEIKLYIVAFVFKRNAARMYNAAIIINIQHTTTSNTTSIMCKFVAFKDLWLFTLWTCFQPKFCLHIFIANEHTDLLLLELDYYFSGMGTPNIHSNMLYTCIIHIHSLYHGSNRIYTHIHIHMALKMCNEKITHTWLYKQTRIRIAKVTK